MGEKCNIITLLQGFMYVPIRLFPDYQLFAVAELNSETTLVFIL